MTVENEGLQQAQADATEETQDRTFCEDKCGQAWQTSATMTGNAFQGYMKTVASQGETNVLVSKGATSSQDGKTGKCLV